MYYTDMESGGEWVGAGVREAIGCFNTTDKYTGIKIKVTDHLGLA